MLGSTGLYRLYRRKSDIPIENWISDGIKKKKNYINHLHYHPPVTNPMPITHCQLLLPPLLLHLCPSIKAPPSSPCPSINVLSSLYTFLVLSASDSLINANEWRLNGLKVNTEVELFKLCLFYITRLGVFIIIILSFYWKDRNMNEM